MISDMKPLKTIQQMAIETKQYKKVAISVAKDFNYGADVILRIKKAKGDGEIQRIMISARHRTDEW